MLWRLQSTALVLDLREMVVVFIIVVLVVFIVIVVIVVVAVVVAVWFRKVSLHSVR